MSRILTNLTIRTGAQTGVDRAALEFALRHGLPYAGWCPHGGRAEDHPDPPGVRARYPLLVETPSPDPAQRTAWNVRDGHATLILGRGDVLATSPGSHLTHICAVLVYLRPCLVVDLDAPGATTTALAWLDALLRMLATPELVLNVAGPRESGSPGIGAAARCFLDGLLGRWPAGI